MALKPGLSDVTYIEPEVLELVIISLVIIISINPPGNKSKCPQAHGNRKKVGNKKVTLYHYARKNRLIT